VLVLNLELRLVSVRNRKKSVVFQTKRHWPVLRIPEIENYRYSVCL